jgi:hypothetical protein
MNNIARIFDVKEKLACVTLDFEMDYGDRVEEPNILNNKQELTDLSGVFTELKVPVSAFVRTDMLVNYPQSLNAVKQIAQDFHCHSHTHNTKVFNSKEEIPKSQSIFKEYFGCAPLGYRAPQGVLYPGDLEIIKECGFKFSASIFPSYRPGKFNNFSMPQDNFMYDNGILEFPFAAVPKLRYIISMSYLKLLGFPASKALFSMFGLPNVLIFDSHLHDYIVNHESFTKLSPKIKFAYVINKYSGIKYFKSFVGLLKDKGYRFITVTQLYEHIKQSYL